MHLKHLNLTTSDVSGLAAFFERFFEFRRLLERGSGAFAILGNDEDFVLSLMKPKKNEPSGYPETFHVGFYVDSRRNPECGPQQCARNSFLLHRSWRCSCRDRHTTEPLTMKRPPKLGGLF
jgi:hypothetical protein